MADDHDTFTAEDSEDSFRHSFLNDVRRVSRVCCILTFAASIFAMVASDFYRGFVGPRNPSAAASVEFPLSRVTDVVADQNGNIIVGVGKFDRLQVYDDSGTFLYGRYVPALGGGGFCFFFDEQGRLNVVSARGNRILTYNAKGRIVKQQKDVQGRIFKKCAARELTFTDSNGNHYSVRNRSWAPEIVRTGKAGRQTLSISTPWYLTPFLGGWPTGVMFVGSGWMSWLLRVRKEREKKRTHAPDVTQSANASTSPIVAYGAALVAAAIIFGGATFMVIGLAHIVFPGIFANPIAFALLAIAAHAVGTFCGISSYRSTLRSVRRQLPKTRGSK